MRSRLLAAAVATALTVPLLGQTVAAAEPREDSRPSLPATASDTAAARAAAALARAESLRTKSGPANASRGQGGQGGYDLTMILNQLMRARDDLSAAGRKRADALLARPTAEDGDAFLDYDDAPSASYCGDVICIHYVTDAGNVHAPDLTDTGGAPAPDTVEEALVTAESIHDTYTTSGYRRPDGDGTIGGGTNLVDVYMGDLGGIGYYGYCTSDQVASTYNRWAYCGIDNDYAEFPSNTPLENQQVTLAHEYYHAVQFAYDAFEDAWIMEATATWAEEQLYDGIDDNRQYLKDSQISAPWSSLDRWSEDFDAFYQYGNWIFFQYLTERWRGRTGSMPTLVLDIWKRLNARVGAPDQFSTQAIQYVLDKKDTSFTNVYGRFADGNRRPAKTYSEGAAAAYRPMQPARTWTLSSSKRTIGNRRFAQVNHLTSVPYRFKPAQGLRKRDWKIGVKVDLPAARTAPVARLAVYLKSGKVSSSAIRFKRTGFSKKVVGFSSRNVKYVELVIVNASRRVRNCFLDVGGDVYACYGRPIDELRRTDFRARVFRS